MFCFLYLPKQWELEHGGPTASFKKHWERWNPYTPSRTRFSNALGHNRSQVSRTLARTESCHTNFSRSRSPFVSKNNESGWLGVVEASEVFPDLITSGTYQNITFSFAGCCKDWSLAFPTGILLLVSGKRKFQGSGLGQVPKNKAFRPLKTGLYQIKA